MQTELGDTRTVGRPKNRWMDVVERDARQVIGNEELEKDSYG